VLLERFMDISDGVHFQGSLVGCIGGWGNTCCGREHKLACVLGHFQLQYR
jgi:hypothetical protein